MLTKQEKEFKKQTRRINELEAALVSVCRKHYEACVGRYRHLQLIYPLTLVRVLPKEHITSGGIYLPETEQNKPVYEGIVIETWKPWDEHRTKNIRDAEGNIVEQEEIIIPHIPTVKPGDRVAFQHFSGISMHGYLDEKLYRLIAEDCRQGPYTNFLGTLDWEGDSEVREAIRALSYQLGSITTSGVSASRRMIDM